jgi:hypothetical protein
MKRSLWFTVVMLSGCATSQEVWGGRTAERETQEVQIATVRWLAANYEPSEFLGTPQAICLVVAERVGRRDISAARQSARNSNMDPPPNLLSRLRGVRPTVKPISDCVYGDDLSEVLADTGERAIVLGVSYPTWVTPNLARVSATLRENQQTWYRYNCSLVREVDGWEIRRCT